MARPYVASVSSPSLKASGSTLTIYKPAGLADGDTVVVFIRDQASGAAQDYTSSGFTRIGPAFVASSSSRINGMYKKYISNAAGEPSTYPFTNVQGARGAGTAFAVRGADPSSPVSVASTSYTGTSITNGSRAAALTVPDNDSLLLFYGGADFSAGNNHIPVTTPSGVTLGGSSSTSTNTGVSRTYVWAGWQNVESGTTGDKDITWGTVVGPVAEMVVFKPYTPAPVLGKEVEVYNGVTTEVGYAYVWDGTTEVRVQDILGLRKKTYTVSEMNTDLNTPGKVMWAHRGGSDNWSEMTMRAYTNAIWHGANTIETSVWRTTDGVFAMSHDRDMTRATVASFDIPTSTWAQVGGVAVDTPIAGGVTGRLEDVLDTYGQTHVVLVEDKQDLYATDLKALIESRYTSAAVAKEHIVVKVYGSDSGLDTAAVWEGWGYRTWAYMFDADIDTRTPAKVAGVSYLGINHNATQGNYDKMTAYNKPLVVHLISSTAQGDAAVVKGADGFQVSNVLAVVPQVNVLP